MRLLHEDQSKAKFPPICTILFKKNNNFEIDDGMAALAIGFMARLKTNCIGGLPRAVILPKHRPWAVSRCLAGLTCEIRGHSQVSHRSKRRRSVFPRKQVLAAQYREQTFNLIRFC